MLKLLNLAIEAVGLNSNQLRACLVQNKQMGIGVKKAGVLYHYPCPDGAFAALAAYLYFSSTSQSALFFPNRVYDPIRVEDLPLEDLDDIYLLDFVGPAGFVKDIFSKVKSVIILDHHKTALEMFSESNFVANNLTKIIDMKRSGATIAYDFFEKKILSKSNIESTVLWREIDSRDALVSKSEVERVKQLFKYIEDADLWRWALPDSKEFSSGLKDIIREFSVDLNPSLFEQLLALEPHHVISQGRMSLASKQKLIDEILLTSYEIALGGGKFGQCLAVDADSISDLRSELGHQLAIKSHHFNLRGIGAVVYRVQELENEHVVKISLRSVASEDSTIISQEYGGGGHKNASSFMLDVAEFEKWKVQVR
ncbi:hypothetical protein AMTRI_Chr09g33410 [Amborella trichopoda]